MTSHQQYAVVPKLATKTLDRDAYLDSWLHMSTLQWMSSSECALYGCGSRTYSLTGAEAPSHTSIASSLKSQFMKDSPICPRGVGLHSPQDVQQACHIWDAEAPSSYAGTASCRCAFNCPLELPERRLLYGRIISTFAVESLQSTAELSKCLQAL